MGTSYVNFEIRICYMNGEPAGIRTQDTRLKRAVLYQLSYRPASPQDAYIIKEASVRQ